MVKMYCAVRLLYHHVILLSTCTEVTVARKSPYRQKFRQRKRENLDIRNNSESQNANISTSGIVQRVKRRKSSHQEQFRQPKSEYVHIRNSYRKPKRENLYIGNNSESQNANIPTSGIVQKVKTQTSPHLEQFRKPKHENLHFSINFRYQN